MVVMVVGPESSVKCCCALVAVAIDGAVGPAASQGADASLSALPLSESRTWYEGGGGCRVSRAGIDGGGVCRFPILF